MKLQYRIVLVSFIITLLIAILLTLPDNHYLGGLAEFAVVFGLCAIGAGIICCFLGLIIFIAGAPEWGKGIALAGGILLLLGFTTCGILAQATKNL